jgi:ubiquinol-cytochrome c reductase iron-sulfur subunit
MPTPVMPHPTRSSDMPEADSARRHWIMVASAAGGIGVAATAVPFVASMAPSERARAFGAPVEVDIAGVRPGELLSVAWRGKPVWILHRTPAMLRALGGHDRLLADPRSTRLEQQPGYARNEWRSSKPEILVLVALCTHLGCVPTFRPEPGAADIDASWPGGFYCPCHGSKFDLAGRVFKNVPAPSNLEVPPYRYADASRLLIGVDPVA